MKFIVRSKKGYGEDIKKNVMKILSQNGADVTEDLQKGCDFTVSIGGDGTILRDQSELDCPVLGINPGKSVGYYMAANAKDYEKKVLALLTGKPGKDYRIHELMRLEAKVNGKKVRGTALNEVLLSSIFVRRIFECKIKVNGIKGLERSTGVIVYTPTGSRAFAHSAGAKNLNYRSDMFGVVAVAPYCSVLKKQEILTKGPVKIECLSDLGEVCLDGGESHITEIRKGDLVLIEKSKNPLRLVGFGKGFG